MKRLAVAFFALFATVLFAISVRAQSISSLPVLSTLMIHHFDCRAAILPSGGQSKELFFQFSPNVAGHSGYDFTVAQGADKVVASVNAQMLQLVWTRGAQTVAGAQTMIQLSPTQAYVLIVTDPRDEGTQVHLGCNAVTFADFKRGVK